MIDPRTDARSVEPTEDGARLRIRWADGHVSEFEPRYLRLRCRCAGCIEEMTGRPLLDPRSVAAEVHPRAIRYVGRYAIRFDWSDGHETGIYPFELLRAACPCAECNGSDVGGDPTQ
jgi:ATP-binding protein involved in chromosome partitioning